jgi:hypothetical protein
MVQDASEEMAAKMGKHITPSILWKYSKQACTLNAAEAEHLDQCQDCVAVLIICRSCKSLQQMKRKLKDLHAIVKRRKR